MPINQTLSTFSDWSYTSATAVYLIAAMFYLAEQAFGQVREPARRLVSAGGGTADTPTDTSTDAPGRVEPAPRRSRTERFGRMAVALTVLGALLHLSAIALRGMSAGRWPLGNMYEYISAVCFATVVTWLAVLRKNPVRRLGAYVLVPLLVLMFLAGTVLYTRAAPVMPALRSYWITIHVSVIMIASGVSIASGVASLLYLVRVTHEATPGRFASFGPRLPDSNALDRMAYRTIVFAFPLLTFGIVAGAMWAEVAWGRYWGWDPKETVAFIAWVVYAAYLHARATAGWRGIPAAWVNMAGFSLTVFNLFFVNLVVAGLHSYAGLPS